MRRIFNEIKQAVSVPEAARYYGINTKGNGMCRCLFHDDSHPSMKLYQDHYYCFGCGAHGDVIDLVSRVFGLSPYEAARKLAADFGIDPDKPPAAAALAKPKPSAPSMQAMATSRPVISFPSVSRRTLFRRPLAINV